MKTRCALTLLAASGFVLTQCAGAAFARGMPPRVVQAGPTKLSDIDARLSRWNESLELDLPGEVLSDGRALVLPGASLANDARAVALIARALAGSGRAAEARTLLETSAVAVPIEYITAERARLALDADDLDGALALLWDSSGKTLKTPAIPDAYWLAGRTRARAGEWDQATLLLQRYLELEPRSAQAASAWHLLALEALRRNDGARAKVCAEHEDALGRWHSYYNARRIQIRENPREPLPRLALARLWYEIEDFTRARAVLDELVALAPDFARGFEAVGETQRRQNDLAGARASYDRALSLDPSLDLARYNRAVIARMQSRDDDARHDLDVLLAGAAARDLRFANAHLDFARLLAKSGEQERAAQEYARYQEFGGKEKL